MTVSTPPQAPLPPFKGGVWTITAQLSFLKLEVRDVLAPFTAYQAPFAFQKGPLELASPDPCKVFKVSWKRRPQGGVHSRAARRCWTRKSGTARLRRRMSEWRALPATKSVLAEQVSTAGLRAPYPKGLSAQSPPYYDASSWEPHMTGCLCSEGRSCRPETLAPTNPNPPSFNPSHRTVVEAGRRHEVGAEGGKAVDGAESTADGHV